MMDLSHSFFRSFPSVCFPDLVIFQIPALWRRVRSPLAVHEEEAGSLGAPAGLRSRPGWLRSMLLHCTVGSSAVDSSLLSQSCLSGGVADGPLESARSC